MMKVLEVDFELVVGAFDEVVNVEAMEVIHFGLPVVVVALVEMVDVVALKVVLVLKVLRVDCTICELGGLLWMKLRTC